MRLQLLILEDTLKNLEEVSFSRCDKFEDKKTKCYVL